METRRFRVISEYEAGSARGDKKVLLTFDDNYLLPSLNLMYSINRYNEGVSYLCICPALNESSVKELLSAGLNVKIKIVECDLKFNNRQWPAAAMFRMFAPFLLEEEDRVLYLDSDMLCKGDLSEIFSLDLEGKLFAICPELLSYSYFPYIDEKMKERNYGAFYYCNSGFLLYDLKEARKRYRMEDMVKIIEDNGQNLKYPDQDILNFYFHKELLFLNASKYNLQMYDLKGCRYYKNAVSRAVILHWSLYKPWKKHTRLHYKSLYYKYSEYPPMKKKAKKWKVNRFFAAPFLNFVRVFQKIRAKIVK